MVIYETATDFISVGRMELPSETIVVIVAILDMGCISAPRELSLSEVEVMIQQRIQITTLSLRRLRLP